MRECRLQEITNKITDGKHGDCKNEESSGFYFISCKDIVDGTILYDQARQITKEDFVETDRRTTLAPNDILITNSGTIGRMAFVKDIPQTRKTTFQKSVAIISANEEYVSAKYLYYLLLNNVNNLVNSSNGSAQKNLLLSTLRNFTLQYEDNKAIQRRISTILSRYDALIENCQKQIKLLEEAAQRLYKHWFVDMKYPGHENTTFDNGLPAGWTRKKIGEVFSYVRGKSYTSKELSDNQGTIMVNLKNIQAFGGYKCDAEKYFLGSYKAEQTLKKGDLVMGVTDMTSERRLVGHVALIPDFGAEATYTMDLIKIIPYSLPKTFIYCAMRYGGVSYKISPLANGVNVLHLKPEAIEGIEMIIPSMHLIESFVGLVDKMIDQILSNQKQIKHLTEARNRLLPRLMSGEIEVS